MWVFGYGSLLWKAGFPFEKRLVGYIKGFMRRFWQGSEDHRGEPGKPGRVVTVLSSDDPEEKVWGVAYQIAAHNVENVFNYLNYREKCGYELETVVFYPIDEDYEPFVVPLYISTSENPFFLGPAEMEDMAVQIYSSRGDSGTNTEYLFRLAEAMKELAPKVHDSHLFQLEIAVRQLHPDNFMKGKLHQ